MVYSISNNKAIITGQNGIYDNKVKSPKVRYGRNACDNYMSYAKDLANLDKMPPLEFEYRYVPDGKYSKLALMGNAYEELGRKTEVSVDELNKKFEVYNSMSESQSMPKLGAEALDLNNDGKVDIAEYSASTMAADMLDKNQSECKIENLDGIITNKGENASISLYTKDNCNKTKQLFTNIYNTFNLNEAMSDFKSNCDNYS